MEKDDVVVGLPYMFKLQFMDLKRAVDRAQTSLLEIDYNIRSYTTQLSKIDKDMSGIRESLNRIFDDMNGYSYGGGMQNA